MSAKVLHVSDEYRTNPLSLTPGGSSIEVTLVDGNVYVYDKIKMPDRYIRSLYVEHMAKKTPIAKVCLEGRIVYDQATQTDEYGIDYSITPKKGFNI
jgi:hypothetical protein